MDNFSAAPTDLTLTRISEEKRFLLLSKEEMLSDGQDEPVTSMPEKKREEAEKLQRDSRNRESFDLNETRESSTETFDPMNPPSF